MQENATTTTAEVVDQVVDGLIEEKGLAGIPEEQKAELKTMLSEQLVKRLNLAILKELPDDKFDEFEKVAKQKNVDYEKMQDVVASANLDMTKILEEVVPEFREKFLNLELNGKAEV